MSETALPHLIFVGHSHRPYAHRRLAAHRHIGAMEICYLASGVQVFEVGSERYVMKGNDVFVTFPDEEHSSGEQPLEKGELYWLQLRLPTATEPFLGLTPEHAAPLLAALRSLPCRHFRGTYAMRRLLDEVVAACQTESPVRALRLGTPLVAFLLACIASARAMDGAIASTGVNQVLRHIEAHLDEPLPVSALAALMGLSLSRFKARFKQEIGMPPAEYCARRRIERAQALLATGHTVTEVAHALGFSSSQHFATVFRRFTARTPAQCKMRRVAMSDER